MLKIIVAVVCCLPVLAFANSLTVTDAWARASIPGTENGAAYATFENAGNEAVTITHVSSDVSRVAEVHRHVMSGDVMKMEAVESLSLDPNEVIKFQPGGYHFMLFGLNAPLKTEERFSLTLHFESGSSQEIEILVK
ncbi:MAG: copper chaperone PCu(A)C [Pseudomonadota bacterium]